MGSKGGEPSPSLVVCCMCGDHGLRQELFRCKVCLVRSQHKYCSDLYPQAESYRACNWCLREEGGGKALSKEATTDHGSSVSSTSTPNADHGSARGGSGGKPHRGAFSSQLSKPIKKQRLPDRSPSDVADRMRSENLSPRSGRGRPAFRGRVRRYKLLEEVSS